MIPHVYTVGMEELVDSALTREEALAGSLAPEHVLASLALIDIRYLSFDGRTHRGQLVVHRDLADEVLAIFEALRVLRFPIRKAIPIAAYGWDDRASMDDDNTSAFNYRVILATDTLSNHAFGRALDINPRINPYTTAGHGTLPQGAAYDPSLPGALKEGSPEVAAFTSRGWRWLGTRDLPDWQHFEKP